VLTYESFFICTATLTGQQVITSPVLKPEALVTEQQIGLFSYSVQNTNYEAAILV
jgi:hypothetical protein